MAVEGVHAPGWAMCVLRFDWELSAAIPNEFRACSWQNEATLGFGCEFLVVRAVVDFWVDDISGNVTRLVALEGQKRVDTGLEPIVALYCLP
jgi:hypothetical protein